MQLLQQLDKNPQDVEWCNFFERITHAAYAQVDSDNTEELCRMAKKWLEHLEKTL